jgi:DNA replication protein DnaC
LRRDKRLSKRLQYAKLRQQACVEDIDYRTPHGLDRSFLTMLVEGQWIDDHANLLICGPSGVGKSWLASALGNKACRDNRSVLYQRVPRLFADLALARGDGRHPRILRALGRVDLLILDDWGLEPLDAAARHDLLEILEDRYGHRSTVVTSQIPVDQWHALIGDPTYADAVLDRLVHNAHRIDLNESLRRTQTQPEGLNRLLLWTCRCAWTTQERCPHAHSSRRRRLSSRHLRLTTRLRRCQKLDSQNASRPRATSNRNGGRDHLGILGEIKIGIPGRDHRNQHSR